MPHNTPMPRRPQLDTTVVVADDPDFAAYSPSPMRSHGPHHARPMKSKKKRVMTTTHDAAATEATPLLSSSNPTKKPFYRARPLWLVPFAVTASLVRGMTLAPRVEVFTQLSCNRLHGHHEWNHTQTNPLPSSLFSLPSHSLSSASTNNVTLSFPRISPADQDRQDSDDTEDPRRLPSQRCLADPAVIAGAARLQAMMTTTMGLLSALTTAWWGHFSERHGRTRVLAIATFGLFLTDLTFILVSTPSSPLSRHGHHLLLIAPIIEGTLGGWSTLQSATSAYLSDCTSPGSRAHIFSRFQGVFYVGFAAGPSIGGWLIQHPLLKSLTGEGSGVGGGGKTVTTVFWMAIFCSFVNFVLVLFVFPESLGKKKMERAQLEEEARALAAVQGVADDAGDGAGAEGGGKGKNRAVVVAREVDEDDEDEDGGEEGSQNSSSSGVNDTNASSALATTTPESNRTTHDGIVMAFLRPLSVFLPVIVLEPTPNGIGFRKRRDWSLTMLALALFGFMLSTGVVQLKYMYAVQTYGWGAEQLGYYISFMGAGRAVWLLIALPVLIGFFKPKPKTSPSSSAAAQQLQQQQHGRGGKKLKPKPTRAQLGEEIRFDLGLTRCSLMMDIVSHSLVALLPGPGGSAGVMSSAAGVSEDTKSQALFVFASSMNGMGSGAVPAIQSLALCVMQVRALNGGDGEADNGSGEEANTGTLFGALAVVQAVGQMILGPMLFGLIYSETAATYPKTIFVVGAGIMTFALGMVMGVRNPVKRLSRRRALLDQDDAERGRSRVSKDLRGGAVSF